MTSPALTMDDGPGLPISEVGRMLGVPIPTLRSWELRYGIPTAVRDSGSHRRYYPTQLHALRLMRDEIARGKRAGAAAKSVQAQLGLAGPTRVLIDEFLAASGKSDPTLMRDVLERAKNQLGLGSCLDEVLLPSMRQIGIWWAVGRCDQDEEHLATESARSWLNTTASHAPAPTQPKPILLACGPADLHTLGIEALALLLRYRRWTCRVMGARIPPASLLTAAEGTGAAGVVVVSHISSARHRAVESIRSIEGAGIEVFYAGNSFASPKSRERLPGLYLGTSLQDAGTIIEKRLSALRGSAP